ncbi:MAG: L,D-transpeptidase family protein [Pseudolabrys sp.]
MNRLYARALLATAAIAAAIALAGCDADSIGLTGVSTAPISEKTLAEMQAKQMDKESPILIRIFKEEAEMEVWKKNRSGEFALLKTYPICRWSGDLGPKVKEGDRQAPEGFYTITPGQMNPNSNYYLAFNTGYPNAFDRAWNRTGSELMVHGDCSSRGCYAMTDAQMQEIYSLARESFFGGQKSFQFEAFPFRMTALNMARHRNNPNFAFWKMIKEGYDHFEATHQQPKVAVCEKRYVFDAAAPGNSTRPLSFNARGACPVFQLDPAIATAVLDHRRQEQYQMAQLIAQDVPVVPSRAGIDGGMNPVFEAKLAARGGFDAEGRLVQVSGSDAPGALPRSLKPIVLANTVPQSAPRIQPAVYSVPVPQPAPQPKEGEAGPQQQPATFGGLFGGSQTQPEPAAAPAPPAESEPIALRGTETTTAAKPNRAAPVRTAAAPPIVLHARPHEAAPYRKPEAVVTRAPAAPPPVRQARQEPPPAAPAPVRQVREEPAQPAPEMRTAFSASPSSDNVIKGAQPVLPANSFEARWAALR